MQVQPDAEELLLHASLILCKSQVILETSKSLLRDGMDARAIASYLQVRGGQDKSYSAAYKAVYVGIYIGSFHPSCRCGMDRTVKGMN
jgi:hypothetical protein